MKLHTTRTLFDKWEEIHKKKSGRIKSLKSKYKYSAVIEEQEQLYLEIEELAIQTSLIHEMLADLGLMVYVEEEND